MNLWCNHYIQYSTVLFHSVGTRVSALILLTFVPFFLQDKIFPVKKLFIFQNPFILFILCRTLLYSLSERHKCHGWRSQCWNLCSHAIRFSLMFMPMWDIGSGSNLDPTRETVKCFCKCEYDNRKAKAKAGLGYGGYDIGSGYEEEHGGSHLGSFLYGVRKVKI